MTQEYQQGDTIYILMNATSAMGVSDDWLGHDYGCDLHIRRSVKNKGMVVIETKDPLWAGRIMRWHGYEKVTYKH